ncbi:hypothetical protein FJZ26_02150 [Candidatus Parvarchaeota archaeon]|nr:hypothetical protein [Candidatus Parvarchaeota archaeon]
MVVEQEFELHGMHCESCEKIIARAVSKYAGASATGFDMKKNTVRIACQQDDLEKIRRDLLEKGYQILMPGEEKKSGYEAGSLGRARTFLVNMVFGAPGYAQESKLVFSAVFSLAVLLIVHAALFMTAFKNTQNYIDRYGIIFILMSVSVVAVLFAFFHARAFKRQTGCMSGMMNGMTIGMMGGFLIGAFAGATNGMYVGSLVGMAVGIGLGFEAGRCCGVMGAMEGAMGGLMAGTMGAMLSVMMVNDHLIEFLFILTGTALAILVGLSYMLYKEHGSIDSKEYNITASQFLLFALAIDLVVTVISIFGPKAGFVWTGGQAGI